MFPSRYHIGTDLERDGLKSHLRAVVNFAGGGTLRNSYSADRRLQ